MSIVAKLTRKPVAKKVAKKIVKKKKPNRMFSSQTGSGRGKFQKGNPPAPKIVAAKDTPFDKGLDVKAVVGREGKSEKAGTINIGDDAVGFSNFLALQKSRGIFKREKAMRALEKIIDKGTPAQKKKAKSMLEKMEAVKKKSDAEATASMGRGRRGKAEADDFKDAQKMLEEDGEMGAAFDRLTKNQQDRLIKSTKLKRESDFKRDVKAKLDTPKKAPISIGSAVENRRKIGMNQGGLKMPSADQTGLKKLPTQVRNKMGYMYGGGMTKKPKMGNMDYRKGGMVMIVLDMMKKKKGKKEK